MMRRIIENSHGHPLKNQKILLPSNYPCAAYSQGKFIIKPSYSKVIVEPSSFLQKNSREYMWSNSSFMWAI
jgi:hypothetical protein